LTLLNGDRYEGEFSKGKKEGTGRIFILVLGTLEDVNDNKYTGEFKDNMKNGHGVFHLLY